jgi:hypothetical protein
LWALHNAARFAAIRAEVLKLGYQALKKQEEGRLINGQEI